MASQYLFNKVDEMKSLDFFDEKSEYMSYRISTTQLKNSLFNPHNFVNLPKDFNLVTEDDSKDDIKNYDDSEDEDEEDTEKNIRLAGESETDYLWRIHTRSRVNNIRCATKLPYESKNNYKNHICKCNNNESCKVDYKQLNYYSCPAAAYNGTNLVKCQCDENIITKIINDWKYLYELDNIDILLEFIDDFGFAKNFHIVIIDKNINIYYGHGFYGI